MQVCSLTFKKLITLYTLYKVSCQGLLITNISLCSYTYKKDMLNKYSLAVKKCEANQKQHCSYSYKRPKSLILGKAKKILLLE